MRGQTGGTTANRHLASPEHDEQSALMAWPPMLPSVTRSLEWLFAIPNGGKRAPATARRLKKRASRRACPTSACLSPAGPTRPVHRDENQARHGLARQKSWLDFLLGRAIWP